MPRKKAAPGDPGTTILTTFLKMPAGERATLLKYLNAITPTTVVVTITERAKGKPGPKPKGIAAPLPVPEVIPRPAAVTGVPPAPAQRPGRKVRAPRGARAQAAVPEGVPGLPPEEYADPEA